MMNVLISVFDKTNIVELAKELKKLKYQIISTGGTAKKLLENNIDVIPIEKITGNPELFDGRMKTISFEIESGILFDRKNKNHVKEAKKFSIKPIDIVICNFYPFEETLAKKDYSFEEVIENIDVGGPTMVRAAAKNFKNVLVITDPSDYQLIIDRLKTNSVNDDLRKKLAAKAFSHLSYYDSQIANFLESDLFPDKKTIAAKKIFNLRYGENPHQQASVYLEPQTKSFLKNLKKISGREMSLINLTDINAGIEAVKLFKESAAVIIKHNTPCGIALGKNSQEALIRAIQADPQSAFGGAIILNQNIDEKTVEVIRDFKNLRKSIIDIIAAPSIDEKAAQLLSLIRKSTGVYTFGKINYQNRKINIKWVDGGFILQSSDDEIEKSFQNWKVVSKISPTKKQLEQMQVAWKFISRIKSNTVIVVDKIIPMTRGIGSGQTSRYKAAEIALSQAGNLAKGAILASDGFFPFDDSVKLAAKYNIGAIIQQGGSVKDTDVIKTVDRLKIPMVFTYRRAFWH
jgi:phosphoribosylaminoimidazolecarboxamide formyltransferase/IMP cyclohydrolase